MRNIAKTAFAFALANSSAWAGTIITGNLPADTVIINISGTQDGAAAYSTAGGDGQALWQRPFNTGGTLLEYTFQPGIYRFLVVDPAEAALLYPGLTPTQTNQIYTAWTYNSPWLEDYLAFDSAAATNSSLSQLFDGAPDFNSFNNAQSAYNDAVSGGWADKIRSGPLGRASTVISRVFAVTNIETLIFVVPDYDLNDNAGGVSVAISPAPFLSIAKSGGNTVTLQWPTNLTGFTLSQSTNLLPASWGDVTNQPVVANTNYSVTLHAGAAAAYFRLHD
ncbi:MAG TPA: hypothetical protein VGO59_12640 [Verrucomicrobiae bacterium]|jgi:hypothetical protein